jgi:hypothetical protein
MERDLDSRILMSDELKGQVPELEDDLQTYEDAYVIGALELRKNDEPFAVVGSLVGISIEDVIKIDLHVSIKDAHRVVSDKLLQKGLSCDAIQLIYASFEDRLAGPFQISSSKMMDFDRSLKMCTLGVDLTRSI